MNNREMPAPSEVGKNKIGSDAPGPVKQVTPATSGIKVVALRAGFYKNSRKVEGDEFYVPSMEMVGTWMQCLDGKVEQEHQKMMLDKKKRIAGK